MADYRVEEKVLVKITSVTSCPDPPSTTLEFTIRNEGNIPIWLVNDHWLIWEQKEDKIALSLNRGKMRADTLVYGYFHPKVLLIKAGESITQKVRLSWPMPLDSLWNKEPQASPHPGEYWIFVRLGYGLTAEAASPQLGESVEAGILRWQRLVTSPSVRMRVPSYI